MIRRAIAISAYLGHQQREAILRWSIVDLMGFMSDLVAFHKEYKEVADV